MIQTIEKYSKKILGEKKYKTAIFEGKYDVDITNYPTTTEVDKTIENRIGRELNVVNPKGYGVVPDRGIFQMKKYNINGLFDKTIENIDD